MVATAIIGSTSANKAASAQRHAGAAANATDREFFGYSQDALNPYIDTGHGAVAKISDLQGLNGGSPSSIQATLEGLPGYQFANTQGLKSTQNAATARGLGVSGAALKGAAAYSTGLANQQYNNLLGGLQATAGIGENAANKLTDAATSTGHEIGENQIGQGNATAAGDIRSGNAVTNSINNAWGAALGFNGGFPGIGSAQSAPASSSNDLLSINENPLNTYNSNRGYYNFGAGN